MHSESPPPGAVPIDMDELLVAIGELYVQLRIQRKMIAQQQQQNQQARPESDQLEVANHRERWQT
jgi:hypothetical protein